MSFIVDLIVDSVVRAITYAIVISVTTSIRNSIRNSISNKLIKKLENFLNADGKVDEQKINSLIKVHVYALGAGLYNVSIEESVFDVLNIQLVSSRNTEQMFRLIKKEIAVQKLKAKMRKDNERFAIVNALEEGFK